MKSGDNSFNYFPEDKLFKLANLLHFIRMLIFCLEYWGLGSLSPLVYATGAMRLFFAHPASGNRPMS